MRYETAKKRAKYYLLVGGAHVFWLNMIRTLRKVLLIISILVNSAAAQHQVTSKLRYHRLICVVPITGTGKSDDPIRPRYVPDLGAHGRGEILAYAFQLSDNGKSAIVEFVAADRAAFAAILADKDPEIRVFERGKHSRVEIETELRKWKKDIDLDRFGVHAQ